MPNVSPREFLNRIEAFKSNLTPAGLLDACTKTVVEWRWATALMVPFNPNDRLVIGEPRGQWRKSPSKNYAHHHGVDGAGCIQIVRRFKEGSDDLPDAIFCFEHEPDGFWVIRFEPDAECLQRADFRWCEVDGTRLLRELFEGARDTVAENVLSWSEDRLTRFSRNWWGVKAVCNSGLSDEPPAPNSIMVHDYEYDAGGELVRAYEWDEYPDWSTSKAIKYLRLPQGVSLKTLLVDVEEILVREIPLVVSAAHIDQSSYALLFPFTGVDTDSTGYSPPLFVASESWRQKKVATAASNHFDVWSIAEFGTADAVRVAIESRELDEKLKLIFQLTIQTPNSNYTPVRKMFQRACARLNAIDWSSFLVVTDDFVVLPVDEHGEMDLLKDVVASVPPTTIKKLVERQFLPKVRLR